MPTMKAVTDEITDSIRAHYATGHFTRDEALARIKVAGWADRTDDEAAALLDAPIDPKVVKEYTGRDITEVAA